MTTFSAVRPVLLLLLLASIWSSSFAVIKIGVETLPPMTLAASRITLAAIVLYGYTLFNSMPIPRDRKYWVLVFLIGFFGNGLPFTLIGWGEQKIDSGLAAILMAVMPLTTVLLVHFFSTDERLTPQKLAGLRISGWGRIAPDSSCLWSIFLCNSNNHC
jgi:drug/metabolite transporter (DMT)-like permease